ncbi:glucosaminidase domain-containing protein [Nitrosophilus kaiyonis]|uniref:glucosaminidase domain-containing protein n=1 Tax=Nitrosophilus kaiyonis TaxID=2930200 RepID=UPI002492EAD2|nr:glucosaminidase domain-containing protein [Nitrosophilus kaiyonis]
MKKVVLGIGGIILATSIYAAKLQSIPAWYYKIKNISKQKEAFFKILKPLVKEENAKIEKERKFVIEFFNDYYKNPFIKKDRLNNLIKLAKKYRIKNIYNKKEYLIKIDTIPDSLVLAQAALESGWGKSRFAREANNLFGEWTFGKNGLIPQNREEGKNHKIRVFKTISDSIASYMLNLNRHRAYKEFRMARYLSRKKGVKFSGLKAAMMMQRYSQIGKRYNKLVSSIIKKNRLHLHDS